jgi:phospholipid/cholesterol/gamma-HCH transport system ATP-binding protein
MVFQGSALFDSMTVEENVAFPLKMFTNDNKAVIKERVDFVLEWP